MGLLWFSLLILELSSLPKEPVYMAATVIVGIVVGMGEFSILASVIDSGVVATFVCLAEGI
jgi:hypothetical protein